MIFAEIPVFEVHNIPLFDTTYAKFSDDLNILSVPGTYIGEIKQIELEFTMISNLKKQ